MFNLSKMQCCMSLRKDRNGCDKNWKQSVRRKAVSGELLNIKKDKR